MIQRFPDWRKRLILSFELGSRKNFKYGVHDCCLAVWDCVASMTGVDLGRDFRGYSTEAEANAFIDMYGSIFGIAKHVAKVFQLPEISLGRMRVGDIGVAVDKRGVEGLCIMSLDGRNVYSVPLRSGWSLHPKTAVIGAWRI